MRGARWALVSAVVLGGLSFTSSAQAFPGQGSCGEAAQGYTVPLAQDRQLGPLASQLGPGGGVADLSRQLHEQFCV